MNKTIKAIFFDLYGTLLEFKNYESSDKEWIKVFYDLAGKPNNLSFQETQLICYEILERNITKNKSGELTTYETKIKIIFEEKGISFSKKELRKIADQSVEVWQKNILPAEDCFSVLNELRKKYKLTLITNFDHSPHIRKLIKQFDLHNKFDLIIISDEVECTKPNPEIFNIALNHFNLKPSEAIYIGDNIYDDIAGSFNAGITPILLDRNSRSNHRDNQNYNNAQNNLPNYRVINSLSELLTIL